MNAIDKPLKSQSFLPNFCGNSVIFVVIISAELLALVLALSRFEEHYDFWSDLALISLFIQWVALSSAAALCFFGPLLARLPPWAAAAIAYGLIQAITAGYSFAALAATREAGFGADWMADIAVVARHLAISTILALVVLRYFYVQQQWKRNVEAESRARLMALQARIRPHFLFNSLNTIASLAPSDPRAAEQATLDLADLFRSSLERKERISLEDEVEITRRYLRLEGLRLGERLQVDWRLEPDLPWSLPIPALILQPLVENAVYHGIEPLAEGGRVTIDIAKVGQRLRCIIGNPMPEPGTPARRRGHQMAQDNIRQRLGLAYGEAGSLAVRQDERDYRVTVELPLREPA